MAQVLLRACAGNCKVADALRGHKQLATPDAPERAILQGLHPLGLDNARPARDLREATGR